MGCGKPDCLGMNWKDWLEKVKSCCRSAGSILADIAGYSFCYFGSTAFWNLMG